MYYQKLLEELTNEQHDNISLITKIINPFALYFTCNHYIGTELKYSNIPPPEGVKNILETNSIDLKDYDILHIQNDYFPEFVRSLLPSLDKKIILTTGQSNPPQIHKSELSDTVLNHPYIVAWVSQNPIYSYHPKYLAFPYGIHNDFLLEYSRALRANTKTKQKHITHLYCSPNHDCRLKLPLRESMNPSDFYSKIMNSRFVISPIGDRDDCYRHYECIGLGAIPISNVGAQYKHIFKNSMYYCDIDEMIKIIESDRVPYDYIMPNRDLICFDYYKDKLLKIQSEFRNPANSAMKEY